MAFTVDVDLLVRESRVIGSHVWGGVGATAVAAIPVASAWCVRALRAGRETCLVDVQFVE